VCWEKNSDGKKITYYFVCGEKYGLRVTHHGKVQKLARIGCAGRFEYAMDCGGQIWV